MGNPCVWFEIPVTDIERASAFYSKVFGVELKNMEMFGSKMAFFPMENDVYGVTGALSLSPGFSPSRDGVLIYFYTADVGATLAAVSNAGGKTLLPETAIGEFGWIAHVEDSEGNRIGIHRAPPM